MKNKTKNTIIGLALVLTFLFSVTSAMAVTCTGDTADTYGVGVCVPTSTGLADDDIVDVLVRVLNWLLIIIGSLAIIAFVISGIQYLTAAGDEKQAETAKRNMKYAIMGITIGLSGLIIIRTVSYLLSGSWT